MNLTSYLDENIKNGDYCTKPPNLGNIVRVFRSDKLVVCYTDKTRYHIYNQIDLFKKNEKS